MHCQIYSHAPEGIKTRPIFLVRPYQLHIRHVESEPHFQFPSNTHTTKAAIQQPTCRPDQTISVSVVPYHPIQLIKKITRKGNQEALIHNVAKKNNQHNNKISMATSTLHINQKGNNFKLTKPQYPNRQEENTMEPPSYLSNEVFTKIINPKQQVATDLIEKCPVISNRVDKYLFVLYDYEINSILVCPMKVRTDIYFIPVFKDLHDNLLTQGIKPSYM